MNNHPSKRVLAMAEDAHDTSPEATNIYKDHILPTIQGAKCGDELLFVTP